MRSCCKVLAVVLTGLALASAAEAQTTLRYKFKEGEKLDYVVDQDQKASMSILGMDIDMKTSMVMEMKWETLKVDEKGNAQAKVTMSRVKMSMEGGPLGKIEIDSTDKEEPDNPIAQVLATMVKGIGSMEMTFTADPTGDVTDVKVSDATIKKLKKLPGLPGGGNAFTPESFKSIVHGSIIIPVPKEAVAKGKTWTQKLDQKSDFGRVTGENKYTYEGEIEKNGTKLEKFAVKPEMKIEADPNAQIKIEMKENKGKGFALFDNKVGRIAEATTEGTMRMEVEAGGMTIDVNSTQTTTIRIKGAAKESKKSKDS